jgi:drug/metabolite transporter (DMT)-like permease
MMLGLLRWPSIHWTLAQAYAVGSEADRVAISTTFAGLNSFLGNYVGEFLGELSFSLFFLLSGAAMLARGSRFPRWVGYLGIVTAAAGLIGMMRNVTGVVAPIAAVNNYLLPLWMIIFGVFLVRYRPDTSESHQSA